ncbi:MAG: Rrf2 family transcriptional regulator [Anaerolineae bacterium]|nr:Rrf2 family transcriptional regulator [Anaerolineae bacterium]
MKLTGRQESFLRQMLDLYHEIHKPLHYSEIAERVGVSRFTAYDMLRLLEEKGLVASEYQLAADKSGPGRSEVVFMPTERVHRLVNALGGIYTEANWEEWREKLLRHVHLGHLSLPEMDVVEELLARISGEEDESLRYCLEVISVIVLRLKRSAGRQLLLEFLPEIMLPTSLDIDAPQGWSLLGGFALGILVQENAADHAWCRELLQHVQRCGDLIVEMTREQRSRLTAVLNDIYASFQIPSSSSTS